MTTTRSLDTPVLLSADDSEVQRGLDYIEELTRLGPRTVARIEAERLSAYLQAFSQILSGELARSPREHKRLAPYIDMNEMVKPAGLRHLFNHVADTTGNVLLSEMIIAPHGFATKSSKGFFRDLPYADLGYKLGFIQSYTQPDMLGRRESVTVPVFTFADSVLSSLVPYGPQKMLHAFQTVMSVGNHDMQHHYSNRFLLTTAFQERSKLYFMAPWVRHFAAAENQIEHPASYESWCMLCHARVRKVMEGSVEYRVLEQALDTFFLELERISWLQNEEGVARKSIARDIDYFSTALCFALMRFVPMNHALQMHAMQSFSELMHKTAPSFESDKLLESKKDDLFRLGPVAISLMDDSGVVSSEIKQIREQTNRIAVDMIGVFSESSGLLPDGTYVYDLGKGEVAHVHYSDGALLDRESHAAVTVLRKNGAYKARHFFNRNGFYRSLWTEEDGSEVDYYYSNDRLHREHLPAVIKYSPDGSVQSYKWYRAGKMYQPSERDIAKWSFVLASLQQERGAARPSSLSR